MKILEMDYSQIKAFVAQTGQPAYRADQIMGWIAKGKRPKEMGNLPKSLVSAMEERGFGGVRLELAQASRDGSEKYLFRCEDGNAVEGCSWSTAMAVPCAFPPRQAAVWAALFAPAARTGWCAT